MRIILMQHAAEGRIPQLQAINTLYLMLLESDASDDDWALFSKVASLPLAFTKFTPKCVTENGYYGLAGKWHHGPCQNSPHCGHPNVEVQSSLQLEPLDHHRFEMGKVIHPNAASWWGQQLAQALGGKFQQS